LATKLLNLGSRRDNAGQHTILRCVPGNPVATVTRHGVGSASLAGETDSNAKERSLSMAFDDDLRLVGFKLNQEKRDGGRTFTLSRNRYLTYWLHVPPYAEDRALFTWEFAIGEYMDEYGLQVGSNEPLNQYLFPQTDTEVAQDIADVVKAMERVETMFAGMNFGHRG
jgi:hypothetical protein